MELEIRGVTTLLEIFDMSRSIAFYRDTLGFEVVGTSRPGKDYTWGAPQARRRGVDAQHGV
jgi:catechol 2,3-dioxygenase-like lactoylglutathione lyase family enzyme